MTMKSSTGSRSARSRCSPSTRARWSSRPSSATTSTPTASTWSSWSWPSRRSSTSPSTSPSSRASRRSAGARPRAVQALMSAFARGPRAPVVASPSPASGVVASCGIGADAFWDGLLATGARGRATDRRTSIPRPGSTTPRRRAAPIASRSSPSPPPAQALEQSGDPAGDPTRRGVWVGTGVGGLITIEEQIVVRHEKGDRRVSPFLVPMMMANARGRRDLDEVRLAGPVRDHRHRVRRRHALDRQRRPAHPVRALRRRDRRQQPRRP